MDTVGPVDSMDKSRETETVTKRVEELRRAVIYLLPICVGALVGCADPDQHSPTTPDSAATESANVGSAYPPPAQGTTVNDQTELPKWTYEQKDDPMGHGTVKSASVQSMNEFEFGDPYQGVQHATLTLRKHPRWGHDVILGIERGQFTLGTEGGDVSVRFDNHPSRTYHADVPSDGSTTYIFIQGFDRFASNLRKSERVYVEAPFYQEGAHTFKFDCEGFKW